MSYRNIHVHFFFCSTQKERNNYCVLNNKITVADDKKLSADYN